MKFRESILRYAEKNGVTKASIKYNVNRQYVYRWKKDMMGLSGPWQIDHIAQNHIQISIQKKR